MKKTIIFGLLATCLFNVSCSDWIDMRPENSLTFRNSFDDELEVETALMATERDVALQFGTMTGWNPQAFGMYTDYQSEYQYYMLHQDQPGNYRQTWSYNYAIIASANVTLPYIDGIDMPQKRKDFYKGQIAFYKAFSYLNLIQRFGDCVLVKDKVLYDPVAKTPWPLVADYAIQQAEEAVRLLPEYDELLDSKGNPVTHRARPCKGAARAVLAHLCAWKAACKYLADPEYRDYDEEALWRKAEEACTGIIMRPDIYNLEATTELVCEKTLYYGGSECVFESLIKDRWGELPSMWLSKMYVAADFYAAYPVKPPQGEGSVLYKNYRVKIETVKRMFAEYRDMQNNAKVDTRRNAWFYKLDEMEALGEGIHGGYAYPYKWRYPKLKTSGWDTGWFENFNQNRIWWRLADIILLRAECRVRLGNTGGAIEDINTIRNRADAKPYEMSEYGGDLQMAVFREREKELLMEDHRWYDILRNGYYKTELYGGFREVTDQDIIDGVFFSGLDLQIFIDNPLMRQNTYWLKRQ